MYPIVIHCHFQYSSFLSHLDMYINVLVFFSELLYYLSSHIMKTDMSYLEVKENLHYNYFTFHDN